MNVQTDDKTIDLWMDALRGKAPECFELDKELLAQTLHKLRTERNMLAYEKGGHQLWKRHSSGRA